MTYIMVSVHGLTETVDYELPNHLTFLQCYEIIKKDMVLKDHITKTKVLNKQKVYSVTQTLSSCNVMDGDALEFV